MIISYYGVLCSENIAKQLCCSREEHLYESNIELGDRAKTISPITFAVLIDTAIYHDIELEITASVISVSILTLQAK